MNEVPKRFGGNKMLKNEIAYLIDNFQYTTMDIKKLEKILEFFDNYYMFKSRLVATLDDRYFKMIFSITFHNGNFRIVLEDDDTRQISIMYNNLFQINSVSANSIKKRLAYILKCLDLLNS